MQEDAIFLVGDVQGCVGALERLLRAASYSPDRHRLILLGDVINRGHRNVAALQLLKSIGGEALRGNHEIRMLRALARSEDPWLKRQTALADLLHSPHRETWTEWIASWPTRLETPEWVAVHGGLHPVLSLEQTPDDYVAFVRICDPFGRLPTRGEWDGFDESVPAGYRPWYEYYRGERRVFYGHWARQGLRLRHPTYGLDSGCVYGQKLSGLWYPSAQLVQVDGGTEF